MDQIEKLKKGDHIRKGEESNLIEEESWDKNYCLWLFEEE
jgi:hypothetical protein